MSLRSELEKVERERARLIGLLAAENAQEDHTKLIEEKTNRLLSDLGNKDTFCQLPLTTVAHVKLSRGSEFCDPGKCDYAETCNEILSLNSESNKKKSAGGGGGGKRRTDLPMLHKQVTPGILSIQFNGIDIQFKGSDHKKVIKEARDHFRPMLEKNGGLLSPGRHAGIGHWTQADKNGTTLIDKFYGRV